MESKANDIRKELENRMAEIQKEIGSLREKRDELDRKVQDAESKLSALRVVYGIEAERLGEPRVPLFAGKGAPSRFTGMRLIDALRTLRQAQPKITKQQARKILEAENFSFRTKRVGSAIHFAWINIDRSERIRQSRKG
jgi:hypothetical protein